LRSLIDIRGFFFDLHLQPKYEQLNFDLTLDTQESIARVKALARETHRRCPQLGLFRLAKIPLLVTWYRAGSGRALFEERFALRAGRTPEERLIAQQEKLAAREKKRARRGR
jgi:hypothetical protein